MGPGKEGSAERVGRQSWRCPMQDGGNPVAKMGQSLQRGHTADVGVVIEARERQVSSRGPIARWKAEPQCWNLKLCFLLNWVPEKQHLISPAMGQLHKALMAEAK